MDQIQTSVSKILNVGSAADRNSKKTIHYQLPTQRSVSHILTSEFDLEFMLSNNDIINYDIRRWISMKTISKKHYEYA